MNKILLFKKDKCVLDNLKFARTKKIAKQNKLKKDYFAPDWGNNFNRLWDVRNTHLAKQCGGVKWNTFKYIYFLKSDFVNKLK